MNRHLIAILLAALPAQAFAQDLLASTSGTWSATTGEVSALRAEIYDNGKTAGLRICQALDVAPATCDASNIVADSPQFFSQVDKRAVRDYSLAISPVGDRLLLGQIVRAHDYTATIDIEVAAGAAGPGLTRYDMVSENETLRFTCHIDAATGVEWSFTDSDQTTSGQQPGPLPAEFLSVANWTLVSATLPGMCDKT